MCSGAEVLLRLLSLLLLIVQDHCNTTAGGDVESEVAILYRISPNNVTFSKALTVNADMAFIGSRNFFIQLRFSDSSNDVTISKFDMEATASDKEQCLLFLNGETCENTIRVLEVASSNRLLVCGTNAHVSKCSYFDAANSRFTEVEAGADSWLADKNDFAIHFSRDFPTDDSLYIASMEGRMGKLRRQISSSLESKDSWFIEPEFMDIYEQPSSSYIHVLFNDKSTYFSNDDFFADDGDYNYYSMVARVCKNDNGGSYYKSEWVTFTRIRLLCAWPRTGDDDVTDLYYDELVASYQVGSTIFTLSRPNRKWKLPNYAVSRYDLDRINQHMNGQSTNNAPTYVDSTNPENEAIYEGPRQPFAPGQCPSSIPYSLSNGLERFLTTHNLVKATVLPIDNVPFYVGDDDNSYEFLFIQEISSVNAIFLLSEQGILKKLVLDGDGSTTEIFQWRIIKKGDLILNAKFVEERGFIIAVTPQYIASIPLAFCAEFQTCEACHKDPHCNWRGNSNATDFFCAQRTSTEPRSCYLLPSPPENILIEQQDESVEILWRNRANSVSHIVTVVQKVNGQQIEQVKHAPSVEPSLKLSLAKSKLAYGRLYKIIVVSLNGSSMSAEVTREFGVALSKPTVRVRYIEELYRIEWLPVTGATLYKIQAANSEMSVLEEVSFKASSAYRKYYHPNEAGRQFTVFVMAESTDLIRSTTVVNFRLRGACSEWSFNYTAMPADAQYIQLSGDDPPTTQEDCGDHDDDSSKDASQQAATMTICSSVNAGNIALGILFITSVLIIFWNNVWVITPSKNIVRDEDGCVYHRKFYMLWNQVVVVKREYCVKPDDPDIGEENSSRA